MNIIILIPFWIVTSIAHLVIGLHLIRYTYTQRPSFYEILYNDTTVKEPLGLFTILAFIPVVNTILLAVFFTRLAMDGKVTVKFNPILWTARRLLKKRYASEQNAKGIQNGKD